MGTHTYFGYKASHKNKIYEHELVIMAESPTESPYSGISGTRITAKAECLCVCSVRGRYCIEASIGSTS